MKTMGSAPATVAALRNTGAFDEAWYLEQYPDVRALGMDPVAHYLWLGARLGRNPNPNFDTNGYLKRYPDVSRSGINPFLHYCKWGKAEGRVSADDEQLDLDQEAQYQRIEGDIPRKDGAPTVIVVAHYVEKRIFGSERSYLDMLDGMISNGFNVIAILPRDVEGYTAEVRRRSAEVFLMPYAWWQAGRLENERTTRLFQAVINKTNADAVHVNTIMLREPLIAAKREGIASLCHVRELIWHDQGLTEHIGDTPANIVGAVKRNSDWIIANSSATSSAFTTDGKTFVLENVVDVSDLDLQNEISGDLKFGIISSNIKKKGIADFLAIARMCAERSVKAKFIIIGPQTDLIDEMQARKANDPLLKNVAFHGYAASPAEAVKQVNVVLSLSHFAESFGRTVLEAMAARRPVIAYKWGAVPELVDDGETGFLVEYRNCAAAADAVAKLCEDHALVKRMGEVARRRAVEQYSKARYAKKLGDIYRKVLKTWDGVVAEPPAKPVAARRVTDVSVVIPNYNYERYLPERLGSILGQTVRPKEIIFLDDVSTDGSVALATKILSEGDVPFEIVPNTQNAGTYRQWLKGIDKASGKFVWIAEADDTCAPDMLETLLAMMEQDESTAIAYCQSRRIDQNGDVTAADNRHHTDDLDPERWKTDYREIGVREVVDHLLYRNTIPNVSACLLRKDAVAGIEEKVLRLRFGGDHLLYCHMLKSGGIAYTARPLNDFRRHVGSVTRSGMRSDQFLQELAEVRGYICENFPVQKSQIPTVARFLDKDYKIEGAPKNSEHPAAAAMLRAAREKAGKRRRIVLLTTNNGSYTGGSEVLWREAAMMLRAEGHDVLVVIKKWEPEPPFAATFRQAGIKMIFKGEDEIAAICKAAPDLVVISMGDQDEGTDYFEALNQNAIKYIIVNQLTKQPEYWPIRAHRTDAVRKGYTNAVAALFTSRNNHLVMERRLETKLPNAQLFYNPLAIDPGIDIPFPGFDQGVHLALPARLLKIHKGQHLAIEMMAKDKWRDRKVTLNLYGEGPDQKDLEEQVSRLRLSSIAFHPRVPDMTEIWRLNHGILMPSFMEGLPIVLTGAMVARRVPIVTDIGGHSEVIEDNRSGFIARLPTVEDVDEAMERAYQRLSEWREIGERARASILDFLPADPLADFVARVLKAAADRAVQDG